MPILLVALFIVFPIVEIAVLVQFGQAFGFWWTLLLIVSTAFVGGAVMNLQGFQVMNRAMESLNAGRAPIGPVVDGAFIMLAGVLLITPGVISDALGALLLVPWIRHRVAAWSVRQALKAGRVHMEVFTAQRTAKAAEGSGAANSGPRPPPPQTDVADGPIIEGDFERIDERPLDGRRGGEAGGRAPPRT